jgi:uroporphyrinogen-III synthase
MDLAETPHDWSWPRVLLPGRDSANANLDAAMREAGFEPVRAPLIDTLPPVDGPALTDAVRRLSEGRYGWVIFTSVPAVNAVLAEVAELRIRRPVPPGTAIAAVGPTTADALIRAGWPVSVVPDGGTSVALGEAMPPTVDAVVLLPRSDLANDDLPDVLRAKGYRVDSVIAYRTVEREIPEEIASDLATGNFAAVVLTSASTARSLARHRCSPHTAVVAIGPSTANAAINAGLTVTAVAAHPTPAGLVAALELATRSGRSADAAPLGGSSSPP